METNEKTPTFDVRSIPSADLLEMLHDHQQAHQFTSGPEYDHPQKAHHAVHFYNMRWIVARELERRGIDSVLALPLPKLKKAIGSIADLFPVNEAAIGRLCKAVQLKTGEHWITVHPHGDDESGVPVLVRDNPDGSSHIIGGAGGSMNFVKLTNLKSPEEWKERNKAKQQQKRAEEKARTEDMTPEQRELERAAKGGLEDRRQEERLDYIKKVYEAVGQAAPKIRTVDEIKSEGKVSEAAAKIALAREIGAHVAAARAQVRLVQEAVLNDHELAAKAGLGDISLGKTQDKDLWGESTVGIDLLENKKPGEGLGIQQQFGKRAEGGGVSRESMKEESKLVRERGHQEMNAKQEAAAHFLADSMKAWNEQVKGLQEKGLIKQDILKDLKIPEPDKIMGILKADRELRQVEHEVKKQKGDVKKGLKVNPIIIGTRDVVDADIVAQFKDEAGVRAARALLSRVDEEEGLTQYVRAGSYATLNEAGQVMAGGELISRDVMDFLGSGGAAQVFASKMRQTLSDEDYKDLAESVAELHGKTNAGIVTDAVQKADTLADQAKKIELDTVDNPTDLVTARTLNEKRLDLLEEARKILGDAYGRVASMGELSLALKMASKTPKDLNIDMGETDKESAVAMARSFGLIPETGDVGERPESPESKVNKEKIGGKESGGDYVIEHGGGHTFITLRPSAVKKLAGDFDPEAQSRYDKSQAVKRGKSDEDGWMPAGIEKRPSTTFDDPSYSLARFDNTINLHEGSKPEEMHQNLKDFVGAQIAEGQNVEDLRTDLYSPEFRTAHIPEHLQPEFDRLRQELFPLATLTDEERKEPWKRRQEILQEKTKAIKAGVEQQAQEYSADYKRRHGMTDEQMVELNTQRIPITEEQTPEAIHRVLAGMPAAAVAFKPMGQLDHEGRAALRDYFVGTVAGLTPSNKTQARDKENSGTAKPEAEPARQMNIFGELEDVKPEPSEQQPEAEESPESKAWNGYVKALGGQQQAYQTIQAMVRGEAMKAYAQHHGRVFGRPLKLGNERLPNWEKHIIGRLPEDKLREALGNKYEEAQKLMAQLARRVGGKFAKEEQEGARRDAVERLKTLMKESQFGLFMTDQFPKVDRPTIGRDAEKQLASVWGKVADNVKAKGAAVNLIPDLSMSGDKMKQQRAVKLAVQNRRIGLHFGAGSGKSLISIGAFTELHSKGQAKKAIFAVPSAVQAQFGSEMLRFTTPGKYKWLADPTADREDRFKAYADGDTHMVVVTHQALRDDIIHAIAAHRGSTPEEADTWFQGQNEETQRFAVQQAMAHHGWRPDMLAVDEAHGLLNRAGKPDSGMARAIDAMSYHMPTYLSMTGTPVKNDASEAFDVLKKIAPHRYKDRAAFLRKYGANTAASKSALQREMAPWVYTDRIASGVNRNTEVREVPLTDKQQEEYNRVMQAFNRVRTTRRQGVDVEAAKVLAPGSFEGQPEEKHAEIAADVARKGLGGRLQSRLGKVVNEFDYPHNAKAQALKADLAKHRDTPHVIFAHHYGSVEHIKQACKELGLRAGVVSGKKTGAEKAAAREAFQGADGKPKFDVLINTDAGSVGQNLQRGTILMNYDTPDTAMTHEQRIARIDRIGQHNDVTVRDYTTDTAYERRARKRLATKYELSDVFQSPSEMLDDTGLAGEIQRVRAERRNREAANANG